MKKNYQKRPAMKNKIIPFSSWQVTDEQKVSIHQFPADSAARTLAFNIVYLEFRQENRHRNFSALPLRIIDFADQPTAV